VRIFKTKALARFARQHRINDESLVEAVHRAGKRVQIWTVDDSETMERLIDAGVDGIFTDFPDVAFRVLRGPLASGIRK